MNTTMASLCLHRCLSFFPLPALLLLCLTVSAADAPKLKPSEPAVKKELTAVVESQLAAFREHDFKTAYSFAASAIKEQFPLGAFEQMVKEGYPVIAQSTAATFGVILDDGQQAVVHTVVKGKSGKIGRYQYLLVREGKGWKINGVTEQTGAGENV
jgi:hypothetical protein